MLRLSIVVNAVGALHQGGIQIKAARLGVGESIVSSLDCRDTQARDDHANNQAPEASFHANLPGDRMGNAVGDWLRAPARGSFPG